MAGGISDNRALSFEAVRNLIFPLVGVIQLGGAVLKQDDSVVTERIGHSFMMPVAARNHPLAGIDRPLTLGDVREEVQLVVTDTSGLTNTLDLVGYRESVASLTTIGPATNQKIGRAHV